MNRERGKREERGARPERETRAHVFTSFSLPVLSKLAHEKLVQLGLEDTVSDELALLGNVAGGGRHVAWEKTEKTVRRERREGEESAWELIPFVKRRTAAIGCSD